MMSDVKIYAYVTKTKKFLENEPILICKNGGYSGVDETHTFFDLRNNMFKLDAEVQPENIFLFGVIPF